VEFAEVPFTAFSSRDKTDQLPGRLVVRRIPDHNPTPDQDNLLNTWRFHAFFTTNALDTVTADKPTAGTRSSSKVHADLKHSALAHLTVREVLHEGRLAGPCGVRVQPHPSRRHPHRPELGESDHRHAADGWS
jgi:hypothetical protein